MEEAIDNLGTLVIVVSEERRIWSLEDGGQVVQGHVANVRIRIVEFLRQMCKVMKRHRWLRSRHCQGGVPSLCYVTLQYLE